MVRLPPLLSRRARMVGDGEIQRLLLDQGLIVLPSAACNSIRSFAKTSNSSDWSALGKRLMLHQEFEEARTAFTRAQDLKMVAVATACCLRQLAYNTLEARQRCDAFLKSAAAFGQCAVKAENIEERHDHHAAAAGCYAQAGHHHAAIQFFELAERYTEAALHCLHNGRLDRAVLLIKKYTTNIDQETRERIQDAARLKYLKEKRPE